MHGSIGVDSQPGEGSRFWVRLPRADAPVATPPLEPPPPAAGDAVPVRCELLCIEDNPANLRLVESIVELRPGVRLLTATAAADGVELARTRHPAAVLLDIHLPGAGGLEVLRRLRADAATRDIPVVSISANAMPADVARGRAAGFDAYLTKPLQVERLLQLIDERLVAVAR